MSDIELPKDAEGHEIPLDTKVLYDDDGDAHDVRRFVYATGFDADGNLISSWIAAIDDFAVIKPEQMYLISHDSWKKLFEDLKAVEDYGKSSFLDSPTCCYTDMVGKSCSKCKFYGGTNCVGKMCADIADRIHKLRSEDE